MWYLQLKQLCSNIFVPSVIIHLHRCKNSPQLSLSCFTLIMMESISAKDETSGSFSHPRNTRWTHALRYPSVSNYEKYKSMTILTPKTGWKRMVTVRDVHAYTLSGYWSLWSTSLMNECCGCHSAFVIPGSIICPEGCYHVWIYSCFSAVSS